MSAHITVKPWLAPEVYKSPILNSDCWLHCFATATIPFGSSILSSPPPFQTASFISFTVNSCRLSDVPKRRLRRLRFVFRCIFVYCARAVLRSAVRHARSQSYLGRNIVNRDLLAVTLMLFSTCVGGCNQSSSPKASPTPSTPAATSKGCANGIKVEPPGSGASADQSRSSLKLNRGCKPHSPRAFLLRYVWCGLLELLPGRNLGAGCRLRRNQKRNQPTGRKLDINSTSSPNLLNL
jgi:hypothetical protein